jgi:hypothetical protein
MNNRLLATALAATAVMLVAATTAPAQVNAGINARANVGTKAVAGRFESVGFLKHQR